jgi:hypothetical protein
MAPEGHLAVVVPALAIHHTGDLAIDDKRRNEINNTSTTSTTSTTTP